MAKSKRHRKNMGITLKQGRRVSHICDKIYADNKGNLVGIYPVTKRPVSNSIFYRAFNKELLNLFFKLLIWTGILGVGALISYFLLKLSLFIAICFFAPIALTALISLACSVISFRGRVLSEIESKYAPVLIQRLHTEVDKIKISDNSKQNAENYTKLDTLSQIVDTEKLRLQKLSILDAISDEYGHDWDYETDTVILNSNDSVDYLSKVKKINPSKLGFISKDYLLMHEETY